MPTTSRRRGVLSAAVTTVLLGGALATVAPSAATPAPEAGPTSLAGGSTHRVVALVDGPDDTPTAITEVYPTRREARARINELRDQDDVLAANLDVPVHATATSDPYWPSQWPMTRLAVEQAWQTATGDGVRVAVVDSGVHRHVDLTGQLLPGAEFLAGGQPVSTGDGTQDESGHGTHVAGTIAALADNGVGVAGVAPDVQVLPVRVLGADGSGYMSDTAVGVLWAVEQGADVVNMSLGSTYESGVLREAIRVAHEQGVVVVASAGNSGRSCTSTSDPAACGNPVTYPASHPFVVAVGATDRNDAVAPFSQHHPYVDVSAPGVTVWSTYPAAGEPYTAMSGTSMAAPHVAAAAALLLDAAPALTPDQVEGLLAATAKDLGTTGRDDYYGHGRIDVLAALQLAAQPTPVPPTAPTNPTAPSPAVPAPSTSAKPQPEPPIVQPAQAVLQLTGSAPRVRFGAQVSFTARVWSSDAQESGLPVTLTSSSGEQLRATTDAGGAATFAVRPSRSETYTATVAHPAAGTVSSLAHRVDVSQTATLRVAPTKKAKRSQARVSVAPAGAGVRVVVQVRTGKAWRTAGSGRTSGSGRATVTFRSPATRHQVRVEVAARPGLAAMTSRPVRGVTPRRGR